MGTQARSSRRSSSPAKVTMESAQEALRRQEEKAQASLARKADSIVEGNRRRLRERSLCRGAIGRQAKVEKTVQNMPVVCPSD